MGEDLASQSWLAQIRRRLESPPPRRMAPADQKAAAVLVPLFVDAGQLWTLLTRRSDALPTHRNQIAFPGGTCKAGEDLWTTALRESEEEIGLAPHLVIRLGQLDELDSSTGFRVVPCVGALPHRFETRLDDGEIAELFRVPLIALANPSLVEDRPVSFDGVERLMRVYHVGSRQIWGLTARILQNLLHRLGLEPTPADEFY